MSYPDEWDQYPGTSHVEPDEADVQRGNDQRLQDRLDREADHAPAWDRFEQALSRADEYMAEARRLPREGRDAA